MPRTNTAARQLPLALAAACETPAEADHLRRRITEQAELCLAHCGPLCARRRVPLPRPTIRFDLRGQAAGQAVWHRNKPPVLRFNLDIALRHANDFITTTVPHEVAHLIVAACHGKVSPHGREWQSVMRFLGIGKPRRCHDYTLADNAVKRQHRWPYTCACSEHQLSTTRHNRVMKGNASYVCRRCGDTLQFVDAKT